MNQPKVSFEGRVAIVTGAGRGLGRAYALELARRGGRIAVNDHGASIRGASPSHGPADAVVAEIREAGGEAIANHDSVADPAGMSRLVEATLAAFGRVDVLVNNAGNHLHRPFAEMPFDAFTSVVETHLFGSVLATQAVWPHFVANRYGRVVFTVSVAGMFGLPEIAAYCAAKGGVFGLMKCLAIEGEREGDILVNAVSPGAQTRMTTSLFGSAPLHPARPELCAAAVAYLASDRCRVSGRTYYAALGKFCRHETVAAPGVQLDPAGDVTLEDFIHHLDAIDRLEGAEPVRHELPRTTRPARRYEFED